MLFLLIAINRTLLQILKMSIADIRTDYKMQQLTEADVAVTPKLQFDKWWNDAVNSDIHEVNAMTLATVTNEGVPDARIVLLKGYDEQGFVFFTNYNSTKGSELAQNNNACLVFFWKELERQVRITGLIEKLSAEKNDEYFNSRPEESRIGAITSPQSQVIESREWLDGHFKQLKKEYKGKNVERPAHWGGYIVKPVIIEFWQGRPGRLHDRLQYSLAETGIWKIERLAP